MVGRILQNILMTFKTPVYVQTSIPIPAHYAHTYTHTYTHTHAHSHTRIRTYVVRIYRFSTVMRMTTR